ncbi:uncharacterized protein L969DRAFT_86641 [Mixia osmundae IAM 14324]|uniref:uncharacterized protein n=1 Tax=Mixia osmundae (strain CBS 9802 / IAM 14324 / JCM 22182 / KY 12970) TaxID=764103 RepID=UPI0004A54C9E|nr:uncharacterized protein L969DRAFT_86641 [Mixia osmundae IAM 14324]KEI40033.1 hypothetical protein L969DRAFT_86641 [Mixia osmundae IAM 14324]
MLGRSALRASLIGSVFSARPMSTGSDWRTRVRQPDCPSRWPYSDADFQRIDESSDLEFYAPPRLVHHIDDGCRAALAAYYDDVLPSKSATPLSAIKVLDLCSSWVSHLPARLDDKKQYHVLGLGMNARELAANEQLSRWLVKDLNQDASLPVETAENESFDAAICSVSIDYLVRPREILREIGRLLKKGSSVHLAFSNRMFATKVRLISILLQMQASWC